MTAIEELYRNQRAVTLFRAGYLTQEELLGVLMSRKEGGEVNATDSKEYEQENDMGDVANIMSAPEFHIRPEDLVIDPRFARAGERNEELEAKKIERMAQSIDRDGQLDAAIVTPARDKDHVGKFVLIAGHRRRRAVILINTRRTQQGKELLRVRVRIEVDGDLIRKGLVSNVHRDGYTPMELAMEIQKIRTEKGWEGFPGAKKIADYLSVDLATVTQHERFLTAPREIQEKLQEGIYTAQGAFEMLNVRPEKQEPVIKRSEEIQRERDQRLTPRAKQKRAEKLGSTAATETQSTKVEDTEAKPTRIEHPSIVQAIRETPDSTIKPTPLSKSEIIEAIEQFDSPAYGFVDGAVRVWARYFVDAYIVGKGTVETMRKKFDAMTVKAPKGKKKDEPEPEAEKGKRRTRKDKKESTAKVAKPAKKVKKEKKKLTKAGQARLAKKRSKSVRRLRKIRKLKADFEKTKSETKTEVKA